MFRYDVSPIYRRRALCVKEKTTMADSTNDDDVMISQPETKSQPQVDPSKPNSSSSTPTTAISKDTKKSDSDMELTDCAEAQTDLDIATRKLLGECMNKYHALTSTSSTSPTPNTLERARILKPLLQWLDGTMKCSICSEKYSETPFTCMICQHTVCSVCVQKMKTSRTSTQDNSETADMCPFCRGNYAQLRSAFTRNSVHGSLVRNSYIKTVIEEKPKACKNRDLGCEYIGSAEDVSEHESDSCEYTSVKCPGNVFGCDFTCYRKDVSAHGWSCLYLRLGPLLKDTDVRIESVNLELERLRGQVTKQQEMIESLTTTINSLKTLGRIVRGTAKVRVPVLHGVKLFEKMVRTTWVTLDSGTPIQLGVWLSDSRYCLMIRRTDTSPLRVKGVISIISPPGLISRNKSAVASFDEQLTSDAHLPLRATANEIFIASLITGDPDACDPSQHGKSTSTLLPVTTTTTTATAPPSSETSMTDLTDNSNSTPICSFLKRVVRGTLSASITFMFVLDVVWLNCIRDSITSSTSTTTTNNGDIITVHE